MATIVDHRGGVVSPAIVRYRRPTVRSSDSGSASRSGVFRLSLDEGPEPVLRVLVDESLAEMLEPGVGSYDGGRLRAPSRDLIERGQSVRVEVSFGAMADEIVLRGTVEEVRTREAREPLVSVRIDWTHAARVRYIHQVLTGGREASARTSRRVPSSLRASWTSNCGVQTSRIQDISKGGVFVRSPTPPKAGTELRLELDDQRGGEPLIVDGQVVWTGRSQGARGFGFKFRLADRSLAGRVAALVRWQEREAGLVD